MKKINKHQIAERERIKEELESKKDEISKRISVANGVISEANEWVGKVNDEINSVNEAIAEYNAAISDAGTWAEEIAGEIQSYMDDRSDKWQGSDAADVYREWLEPYEGLSFQEVEDIAEVQEIVEIDEPDMDHADEFTAEEFPEEKPDF